MSDPAPIQTREEWRVESIGGGIAGTRAEIECWLKGWRSEYGDRYPVYVERRTVTETAWESVPELEAEAGKR